MSFGWALATHTLVNDANYRTLFIAPLLKKYAF